MIQSPLLYPKNFKCQLSRIRTLKVGYPYSANLVKPFAVSVLLSTIARFQMTLRMWLVGTSKNTFFLEKGCTGSMSMHAERLPWLLGLRPKRLDNTTCPPYYLLSKMTIDACIDMLPAALVVRSAFSLFLSPPQLR